MEKLKWERWGFFRVVGYELWIAGFWKKRDKRGKVAVFLLTKRQLCGIKQTSLIEGTIVEWYNVFSGL